MKKLVISTLLACACFGAGLSSEVKGYLDYIAQNACNDEKLKELYESCLPSGPIFCARMRDAECPFELEMQDDKTVQKLAAVIKKELANRTETFGEIFKYAKQKGISFDVMLQCNENMLKIISEKNLAEHAKDIRAGYGSLKDNANVKSELNYLKASKQIKNTLLK